MDRKEKKIILPGVGLGLILGIIGLRVLWQQAPPISSQQTVASEPSTSLYPQDHMTAESIALLKTEINRLESDQRAAERRTAAMERELASLHSQSSRTDQSQESAEPPLSPEEELQRTEAQSWAQVELFEGAIHTETADPQWTTPAEATLKEAFLNTQGEEGLQLLEASCRTTLCRMKLSRDESISPEESFRQLTHRTPWQGQSFVRIDLENSADIIVYLSREGYSLPQVTD
jgi:hypothetical protein